VLPELLVATEHIKNLIINQSTASEILETAHKEGYKTMKDWGEILVKDRTTSRAEVARVTAA
jgi:type II secretory ATPase GspE/PulE/Tfp pilus assembly ATPase PilB-like protein